MLAALIAAMALAALALQFLSVQRNNADDTLWETLWRLGRFFTILTNGLVAGTFAVLAIRGRVASPVWLGGVTLWIGITGAVYHLLLAETDGEKTGIGCWANFGIHTSVPIVVLLWWLAFAPRDRLNVTAALVWMSWPLIYVCYALLRGQFDGAYPYFFTNPDRIGWTGVLTWSAALAGAFFVAGLLQIALARVVRNR
ncbi:Pr6Pr family membrane protein [Pseudooceanicola batsensis]|uniref:Pr6Pr family membrane protein n=1 Tax=Pseudooceanicola batsensis TaxID=314255 RepID=UPI001EE67E30|nr:Pr6Pr family membrane protein [Pseudooceanicola batsensis]